MPIAEGMRTLSPECQVDFKRQLKRMEVQKKERLGLTLDRTMFIHNERTSFHPHVQTAKMPMEKMEGGPLSRGAGKCSP